MQLLRKLESTVMHLNIAVDDTIQIAKKIDIWLADTVPPIPDKAGGGVIVAECQGVDDRYCDL